VNINLLRGPLESAKICADGQEDISAPYKEDIKISKMEDKLRLVHPLDNDFFEACREKLGWSLDISKQKL
jgi:NAD+ kinase